VLNNIAHETDSSVVMVLLRQLATTLAFYVSPDHRDELTGRTAQRLWELSDGAEAGSDSQLQFVKAFAAHARSSAHLETVAALLSGERTLPGLTVDADLRWELLTSLVAGGEFGQAEIDAELDRDSTATGARAAALAKAAIPTANAKAEAWNAVVVKTDLPNATQQSIIAGFNRVHDRTLLEPYAAAYFAAVRDVWNTRTHEIAQQIAVGLYPSLLTSEETIGLTDEFLGQLGSESPSLRRLVLENRDGIVLALRAQAADR
jgi:aminopeptidase N